MFDEKPTRNHRANIVKKSGENNLRDVNQDETDERKTGHKVNRPRSLATTKHRQQPWECRIDHRRHRESSQHDHRRHDEQDTDISQFLEHVVPLRLFTDRMSEQQMIFE